MNSNQHHNLTLEKASELKSSIETLILDASTEPINFAARGALTEALQLLNKAVDWIQFAQEMKNVSVLALASSASPRGPGYREVPERSEVPLHRGPVQPPRDHDDTSGRRPSRPLQGA